MPEELDMLEAAVLPEADPLRQEWERKIAASGPDLQAQWRELVAQAEQTRLLLRRIELPEGLFSQLLAVPTTGEMGAAAMLPAGDPVRHEWETRLGRTSAGTNGSTSHAASLVTAAHWRQAVAESDALRAALMEAPEVELPPALQRRLLAIPSQQRWWQVSGPVRWAAAAVAAVLLYYVGDFSWNQYQAFNDRRELAQAASLVVSQQLTPPAPLIESGDVTQVTEILARQGMAMPPLMIEYREPGTRLTGGGVTTFNGQKAYFTLWEWEGKNYTLYQFVPATFHLRDNFITHETVVSTAAAAKPPGAYRVWSWSEPEHHCGWVLVAAASTTDKPFVWY